MKMDNALAHETSPYLLAHANNPVQWYPWNEESLKLARDENKPILLSIGYAACHWCHVMAHESFEDDETAKLMNKLFINIKVDREERPDLDKVYQTTHYLLTEQSGGWPLTVFLTPNDRVPFFSGTYFPKEARFNLPSFKEVLQRMSDLYQNSREGILHQNNELLKILRYNRPFLDVSINEQPLYRLRQVLQQNYDEKNGGFGAAPKFPHPMILEFLISEHSPLAFNTLFNMANGGIYDQFGGGFFRYTVDASWRVPHFEKMLYDNAQLLSVYAQAAAEYNNTFFANIARETGFWLLAKMQDTKGGFYSSLDADLDGQEGKTYLWDKKEFKHLLTTEEYNLAVPYFGLNDKPNVEEHWHLYNAEPLESIAKRLHLSLEEANIIFHSAKEKLLQARNNRPPPHCDTKILTAWNSIMIKALFIAGDILHEPQFITTANKTLSFIHEKLWINKKLYAIYHQDKARFAGYLDDYAFLLSAIITKLQMHWDTGDLLFAIEVADQLLNEFMDNDAGGFYFTANDHEKLIYRPKTLSDEALPSGNGVVLHCLLILGNLLGETRYLDAAYKLLTYAWEALSQHPSEHISLIFGLKEYLAPPYTIVIRGPANESYLWKEVCKQKTNAHVFAIPDSEQNLPGLLNQHLVLNKTCAYICKGTKFLSVIDDVLKLKQLS